MSGSSRDFYHSSSGRSRGENQPPNLPPIREIVGDVLEQPAIPRSGPSDARHSTPRPYTSTYTPSTQAHVPSRGHSLQLPPIHSSRPTDSAQSRSSTYYSSSSSTSRNYDTYSSSRPPSQNSMRQEPPRRGTTPGHSYDVFVASDQGLLHRRTSDRDDFHQVAKEDAISTSTGRHECPQCGRRFEKLSTLKNHLTTHSGERPYACPDCGKTFSVSSNMKRHQQTHRAGGSSGDRTR